MPNGQWVNSDRASELPPDWATRKRAEAFRVYGDICHVCGLPGANEIDHVQPGNDHSIENTKPVHGRGTAQNCHQRKSSAEGGRAAQARRPKRQRDPEPHPGLLRGG
jgi:5-methylcytosine-specific restriction protein A